jgi:hypothetical protein
VFAKRSGRVRWGEVTRLFFAEVDALSRQHGWTGEEPCFGVAAYDLLRMAGLTLAAVPVRRLR